MTKRIFSIEWDDSLGSMWMNEDNLAILCFTETKVHRGELVIDDITDEIHRADKQIFDSIISKIEPSLE